MQKEIKSIVDHGEPEQPHTNSAWYTDAARIRIPASVYRYWRHRPYGIGGDEDEQEEKPGGAAE